MRKPGATTTAGLRDLSAWQGGNWMGRQELSMNNLVCHVREFGWYSVGTEEQ